jgi:hypothetical protein
MLYYISLWIYRVVIVAKSLKNVLLMLKDRKETFVVNYVGKIMIPSHIKISLIILTQKKKPIG